MKLPDENDEDYPNAIATYKKIIEGGEEMSPYCKELAEEELKKFKPSLDVDEAEGAIYSRDLTDVIDILQEMLKETSVSKRDSE